MMISFPFLTEPIHFSSEQIPVLCLENQLTFRKTVSALYSEVPEENDIIFSENYEPFPYKNHVQFITDYCSFHISSSFLKKLYTNFSAFCVTDLAEETAYLEQTVFNFLDKINAHYDFDFSYNEDFCLPEFFKSQSFLPDFNTESSLENLLSYILIFQKYCPMRCFILLNLHQYFSESELEPFFKELLYRKIPLLLIESGVHFEKASQEKLYILDKDLCEILESKA